MMRWFFALLMLLPAPALGETLVAARTIRAQAVLSPQDVVLIAEVVPGALADPSQVVGLEARVVLYAGRPIRPGDVGPPAVIERNQIVSLSYRAGVLNMLTEGRALGRGGVGDVIRVMNLSSRNTVTGTIGPDGLIEVGTVQ